MEKPRPIKNDKVSPERLKEVLDYDPDSGVFRWKAGTNVHGRRGGRTRAGQIAGGDNGLGYLRLRIDNVLVTCHRAAWAYVYGSWPAQFIDHVNGDRSDNRAVNLRLATRAQNNRNSGIRRDSATGIKGVSYRPGRGGWIARIRIGNTMQHLGSFPNAEEAEAAYKEAAERIAEEFSLHRRASA